MTLIHEVDLPNALSEYCRVNNVSSIVNNDNCWKLHPTQQQIESGNDRIGYTNVNQFDWYHPSLIKPTSNQIITVYDNFVSVNLTNNTSESLIRTAQNGLKDKVILAEQFSTQIMTIYNLLLDQTINGSIQPARYNTLKAAMDATPNNFKNTFNADLLQETGININTILPINFPDYCSYLRLWITQVAQLLIIRKLF